MYLYLLLSISLFFIGVYGLLSRKHIILTLISLELILLSINFNFIIFSAYLNDIMGQIFMLLVLTVGAGEIAIGLAILIVYFRLRGSILTDLIKLLKG